MLSAAVSCQIQGPVPITGPYLRSPVTATASGATILACPSANASRASASSRARSICKDKSSKAVAFPMEAKRGALGQPGVFNRSRLKTTSSAVNARPLTGATFCQRMSERRLKT